MCVCVFIFSLYTRVYKQKKSTYGSKSDFLLFKSILGVPDSFWRDITLPPQANTLVSKPAVFGYEPSMELFWKYVEHKQLG